MIKQKIDQSIAAQGGNENEGSITPERRALLRGAVGLSAFAVGGGLMGAMEAAHAGSGAVTSFAIAVLPDTQFYSRYATTDEGQQFQSRYGSTPYAAQTKWIADNAAAYNIPFVIHLGDVVDQQSKPKEGLHK